MNNGFLLSLGLCRKAGSLLRGKEETLNALATKMVDTVFVSADISERSKRDVLNAAEGFGKVISLKFTKEELGYAAGVKPMAIFSVKNEGLLNLLVSKAENNKEADI